MEGTWDGTLGLEPAILFSREPVEPELMIAFIANARTRGIGPFEYVLNGGFKDAIERTSQPDGSRFPKIIVVPKVADIGVRSPEKLLRLLTQLAEFKLDLVSLDDPFYDTRESGLKLGIRESGTRFITLRSGGIAEGMREKHAGWKAAGIKVGRARQLPPCATSPSGCGHGVRTKGVDPDRMTDQQLLEMPGAKYHLSGKPKTPENPYGVSRCACGCRDYIPKNSSMMGSER